MTTGVRSRVSDLARREVRREVEKWVGMRYAPREEWLKRAAVTRKRKSYEAKRLTARP